MVRSFGDSVRAPAWLTGMTAAKKRVHQCTYRGGGSVTKRTSNIAPGTFPKRCARIYGRKTEDLAGDEEKRKKKFIGKPTPAYRWQIHYTHRPCARGCTKLKQTLFVL
ncbi:Hypothetical protein CINCED_3A003124 [Cinara cedri]|uniref:Uncharacterized protein n=1 Tax=Cinara cedri TaxID=506608 RepID=A0A5E4MNR9_9HEMI|nr:Hypothetical protein CINCED_3A003124 [Cinara cedri]